MAQQRASIIRILIAVGGILAVAFLVYYFLVDPYLKLRQQIQQVDGQIDDKFTELTLLAKSTKKLNEAQVRSLPVNPFIAKSEYSRYLNQLLTGSGVVVDFLRGTTASSPQIGNNNRFGKKKEEPVYTPVTFTVKAQAQLTELARMLDRFHNTPIMHKIKTLTMEPQKDSKGNLSKTLDVSMTIEALIIDGASKLNNTVDGIDDSLIELDLLTVIRGGPAGFALIPYAVGPTGPVARQMIAMARPNRNYQDLVLKNLFVGGSPKPPPVKEKPDPGPTEPTDPIEPESPPGPDLRPYIHLVLIVEEGGERKALFYNRALNDYLGGKRGVQDMLGFNSFYLFNEDGSKIIMRGKVIRITQRDVIFEVDDNLYNIHVGQSLGDAMRDRSGWNTLFGTGVEGEFLHGCMRTILPWS